MSTASQPKRFTSAKLFWYLWIAAALLLALFAGLAYQALAVGMDVNERIINFQGWNHKLFYTNIFSYLVLLVVAAYRHKTQRGPWLYIPAALLFILFANIEFAVLHEKLYLLKQQYLIDGGGWYSGGLTSAALTVAGFGLAVILYLLILFFNKRKS